MPKRPPYLEIAVTIAAMAFLALVVAGSIDTGTDTVAAASARLP